MKKITILMICLVLLAPLAFTYDYGNDPDPGAVEPRSYDDAKVLRVKYTQGEAYVKRSYDDGFEEAAINLPIFEKDTAGTTDGRLEVYMGRLNYLRLDYDTEVVFDKVPALRKTDLSLKVIRGGIYLDIENLDYERDIELQTPDCGVFLLDRGAYRINVSEGGRTEIYVYDGIAEVAGDNYSRNVRENQKIVMFNGRVKERPFYFYSTDKDDFDRWNQDRTSGLGYARYGSSQYLDSGYEEYEHELSRNGNWRYHDTYNTYIWTPYSVGVDWRPYYHGRWIWNPYYGYVWNSFDSWGSFTHHYGRWHWDPFYHWHWIPGYRWSPAWVSWFGDDYYYGWCPLSWWNRPVVVYGGRWWRNHRYRNGIPFHARSTTIIRKSQLSSSGVHRVALRKGDTAALSKKSLVFKGNAPNMRPVLSKVDVINARGKKVVYKKNGLVSTNKYKVMKTATGITTKNKSSVYKYSGKKLAKEKVSKYTKSPYTKSSTFKSKSYKYGTSEKSGGYKIKKYPSSSSSSGYKSKTKSRSSSSSSSSSGSKSKVKKSSSKSSSSKSKSSSSKKSSGSKAVKKKKSEPSYSYKSSGSSSSYSSSSPYSSKSYSSKTYKKKPSSYSSSYKYPSKSKSSYKSYSSSSKSKSYNSSYKSSYKKPPKSYSGSSYQSRSSSSYKSYSKPSSSYKSYSKPSSSYKSSSKSYSKPSSSYKSSSRSSSSSYKSSSKSSSSRSSRSTSSSSSSSSYKKKK